MDFTRRSFLGAAAAASTVPLVSAFPTPALAAGTIPVASLHDLTGPLDIYGAPAHMCMKFAVDEINASGGLLGKQIDLKTYDGQSDIKKFPQYAQQAALNDKVKMLLGAITGASREATRPVLRRYGVPFFYTAPYEGGICEKNAWCTNTGGSQQLVPLIEWGFRNLGKTLYYIGSDYNAPRNYGLWNHVVAEKEGGKVVADDFYPLDVTDFSSAIAKIQAAKPDFIHSCLVGGPSMSFYRQWAAAGMAGKIPIISSVFGGGNEHEVLSPAESDGIYAAYNYFQELDNPANKDFLARLKASVGDHPYINVYACAAYTGTMMWAAAVRKADSVERNEVMAALESGLSYDGPSGLMVAEGVTHNTTQDVHVIQVKDRKWSLVETIKQVKPNTYDGKCNVVENPNQTEILFPQT
ncbi:urea ABC transporter substrate-binding protein [Rhizobium sp.]